MKRLACGRHFGGIFVESMPLALGLFALTYILMLCLPKYRRFVALGSAAVFLATGMLP